MIRHTTTSLEWFGDPYVGHREAGSPIGWRRHVDAIFGCQAHLRRSGFDKLPS